MSGQGATRRREPPNVNGPLPTPGTRSEVYASAACAAASLAMETRNGLQLT